MRVILRSSIPTLGCVPCVPATPPQVVEPGGQWCSVLTSWVTRPPIWMGGGVGTEELFTCQARGLALNTRLASLRLAEEGGWLLTWLVPLRPRLHPRGELFV